MILHLHDYASARFWTPNALGLITFRQQHLNQALAHISKPKEQQDCMPSSIQGASEVAPRDLRSQALAHMYECVCRPG